MEYILAFGSVHRALKAEAVLKESGAPFKLLPAPRALAEYCDLVISVREDALSMALEGLRDNKTAPRAVYKREGDEYVKV